MDPEVKRELNSLNVGVGLGCSGVLIIALWLAILTAYEYLPMNQFVGKTNTTEVAKK